MKKTYMTPAISVMAMETAAILADSNLKTTPTSACPVDEDRNNLYSKDYTFEDWED